MKNFDMFKMGFWSTMGRSTAKLVIVFVGSKIIFKVAQKYASKGGEAVVDSFVDSLKEALKKDIDILTPEETTKLTEIIEKMNAARKTEEPEEETEEK